MPESKKSIYWDMFILNNTQFFLYISFCKIFFLLLFSLNTSAQTKQNEEKEYPLGITEEITYENKSKIIKRIKVENLKGKPIIYKKIIPSNGVIYCTRTNGSNVVAITETMFTLETKGFTPDKANPEKMNAELVQLKRDDEKKTREIEELLKLRELKDAELRDKELEIMNQQLAGKEKTLALLQLRQEREKQAIEFQLKENELVLQKNKTELKLFRQTAESIKDRKELELEKKENLLKASELKQERTIRYFLITGVILVLLLIGMIWRNSRIVIKTNRKLALQNHKIEVQRDEIQKQKHLVDEKNKDILDSFTYAQRIQEAVMPLKEDIMQAFKESFVLFLPKEVVSGDFYWFASHKEEVSGVNMNFLAASDCTGHGVPGAFMSMLGCDKLNEVISHTTDISKILEHLNLGIKRALRQSEKEDSTRDGMDIALCCFNPLTNILEYAGANRPLWIIKAGDRTSILEIKATKVAIGGLTDNNQIFEKHRFQLDAGDAFYIFSDGYADQFNPQDKKLMTKRFKEKLISIQQLGMSEQEAELNKFIEDWRGNMEQTDDILVVGVKV